LNREASISFWGVLISAALFLTGCSTSVPVNPTPSLSSISPTHISAGSAGFTLNAVALNIVNNATVDWNGNPLTTTLNTTTGQLAAQVPAALIASPGTAEITVVNPTPGGGTSLTGFTFYIDPVSNPAPAITSLSPPSQDVGGAAFTLTVNGSGFVGGVSTVEWNGQPRMTTFVSASQLTAAINASDISAAGTESVTVVNPSPGGGTSNSEPFYVDPSGNPIPGITSLNPSSVMAGSGALTLSISGRGFVSNSVANWNGSARATTFTSSSQISAAILATDVTSAGVFNITVNSPAPGGGTSLAQQFTVDNSSPTITGLSPSSAAAGGAAFMLTVNGTNFVVNSAVSSNGSGRETTYVSATQLNAAITAGDIAVGGTASVTVVNPAPGGGTSSPETFRITGSQATPALSLDAAARLVSVSANGGAANGPSGAARFDGSGRFVVFQSAATNLVRNGSGWVFVRDTCSGALHCSPQTLSIDIARDGSAGNSPAGRGVAISGDGRFVAFSSRATNLVAGEPPEATQIYLRDTCMGADAPGDCAPKTILVSASTSGNPGSGASEFPSLSFDGRFVSFTSVAGNLIPNVTGGNTQIYVRDTCLGISAPEQCVPRTILISQDAAGRAGKGSSLQSAISADGRYVAFDSDASNVIPGPFNGYSSVLLRDVCLGSSAPENCAPSTQLLSTPWTGAIGDGPSFAPAINSDGRYVAFVTRATNLISGTHTAGQQIAVRDTCLGDSAPKSCVPSISIVTSDVSGDAHSPAISADGSFVSFIEDGPSRADDASLFRAYVRSTCVGVAIGSDCSPHTTMVSISQSGKAMLLPNHKAPFAVPVSDDGTMIAIFSVSPPSVSAGTPLTASGFGDVYLLKFPTAP